MGDEKEQGYIKKTITFLVPTQCGDRFLNKDDFKFHETKSGKMVIVEELTKEEKA